MKKITLGGKIIGILELIVAIFLFIGFAQDADRIKIDRILDSPKYYFPVLALFIGLFKTTGIIIIWLKKKFGIAFYSLGCFIFITFLSIPIATEREFSQMGAPLLLMYALIALQFVFIYFMSKAIKTV